MSIWGDLLLKSTNEIEKAEKQHTASLRRNLEVWWYNSVWVQGAQWWESSSEFKPVKPGMPMSEGRGNVDVLSLPVYDLWTLNRWDHAHSHGKGPPDTLRFPIQVLISSGNRLPPLTYITRNNVFPALLAAFSLVKLTHMIRLVHDGNGWIVTHFTN